MEHVHNIDSQLQLLKAIKANDSVVLKQLYVNNYHKIETLVLKNNGSKEHAKDIYQEAFIVVWKNVKNDRFIPENETALQGYLYRIARNKWMDILRSPSFKKTKIIQHELNVLDKGIDLNDHEKDGKQEFFEKRLEQTMEAFKNLGAPCKELLTAFYYEKASLREIANKLKIEENSVRTKKYRCMEKLRQLALASKK
ncbi:RNA polymerase sigma factor [Gelidibacter maritimus]|uniref:Sigma-70 family RNA polymerase sigma factor n=1 Tax=Gelidibacter maritimus TaxID=2761487 RepID=A0A7W2M403_9FLAO|nr:sigma-70 family RNA polymerase sigma factor [Gelidibacter maritimus]MBA6152061.1 sigma-70 family RNA polymerase sigma factor [Gelidibacter maritimus]